MRLSITKKGLDLLAKLAPVQQQVNDVQFEPLEAGDMQALQETLEKRIKRSDRALKLQDYLLSAE